MSPSDKRRLISHKKFIAKLKEIHGDTYDYTNTVYEGIAHKITYVCSKHGEVEQIARNHLYQATGCPSCKKLKRITTAEYIQKSMAIWGDLYTYEYTKYVNLSMPVTITCHLHGDFEVNSRNHLKYGVGCKMCKKLGYIDESTWLKNVPTLEE